MQRGPLGGPRASGQNGFETVNIGRSGSATTDRDGQGSSVTACRHCGREMVRKRSTKSYCSEACRKAAQRAEHGEANPDEAAQNCEIIAELKHRGLVGQVWPVFSWDDSPPVFAAS